MKKFNILLLLWLVLVTTGSMLAQSCTATATLNVTINNPPTVGGTVFNTGCTSNSGEIQLTVSGTSPYTYTWSNGSHLRNIRNLTAGNYTVTVSSANGCTKSTSFTVATGTGAPVPQSLTAVAYCTPTRVKVSWKLPTLGSVEMRYKATTSSTWVTLGNIGTVETYTVTGLTKLTTYRFQVRYVCPDGVTKSAYASINKRTGNCATLESEESGGAESTVEVNTSQLELFPNPANNEVNIKFNFGVDGDASVKLLNLIGQEKYSLRSLEHNGNETVTINVADLPAGIYFVVVKQGMIEQSRKLIIN